MKTSRELDCKVEMKEDNALSISAETKRLFIRSIRLEDEKDYVALFCDEKVCETFFGDGKPRDEKTTKQMVQKYLEQWKKNAFGKYTLLEKETGEFLGLFGFTLTDRGKIETSYAIHQRFWGKGYVSEAAKIMFQSIIPQLMLKGYWAEHAPLKFIKGVARFDNLASQRILKRSGFHETNLQEWGRWCFYQLSAKQKCNHYQNFFRKKDLKLHQQEQDKMRNKDVDITQEEMAASDFGQQSYTAKIRW